MTGAEVKDRATQRAVDALASQLRRRQLVGSREAALQTVHLLRKVVAAARFDTIDQLLETVRLVGKRLAEAQPRENSVGNIVRKVLKLIRDEYAAVTTLEEAQATLGVPKNSSSREEFFRTGQDPLTGFASTSSVARFVLKGRPTAVPGHRSAQSGSETPDTMHSGDVNRKAQSIKPALIDAIQEVIDELETVYENISKNARDHIHSDDIVLTVGKSKTVESFFKAAARDRKFTVIVAETAPSYSGREMAALLADAKISTVLVPDSCLYALMSRVNKVVLGAHAVMANGGMFGISGSLLAASAAKDHSTPVIVCTGQFKLTPLWNLHYQYASVDLGDPEQVLNLSELEYNIREENVDILNPWFDYVKPELIDVLITNYGDHPPAYVYRYISWNPLSLVSHALDRMVTEMYDEEDNKL
ncbi:uncharacterized protein EI90DRAFT_2915836 [Cantharellus anzutake]|uniref:uncharacterized protein n=1 Tax=Cantharellus anzutake TaxID=1750568 RepID=UPI00190743CF|nr:uncharacterized protein EI90DRAFT_2915836 [Cantharellus anzutake]KAF8334232.1 hypothetical protein EI90DRAFT_2915836 [Cantharellus anzutake]